MNSTTQLHKNPTTTYTDIKPVCIIYLNEEETSSHKASFDNLLIEAVDSTFSSLLGDSSKQTLYYNLSTRFSISRESIPRNLGGFANALEQIFGQSALLLETRIMQALHSKTSDAKVFQEHGELSFAGYVENLRRFFKYSATYQAT